MPNPLTNSVKCDVMQKLLSAVPPLMQSCPAVKLFLSIILKSLDDIQNIPSKSAIKHLNDYPPLLYFDSRAFRLHCDLLNLDVDYAREVINKAIRGTVH